MASVEKLVRKSQCSSNIIFHKQTSLHENWEERIRMNNFMWAVQETRTNLALVGKVIDKTKVVHVIMNVFSQNYESFIQSIVVGDELLGLEKSMGKFILEEQRKDVCFGGLMKM